MKEPSQFVDDYYGPDKRIVIPCSCGCSIVTVCEWVDFDEDDPQEWFLEVFKSDHGSAWRWRWEQIWRALLGKETISHAVSWRYEQAAALRDWLNKVEKENA